LDECALKVGLFDGADALLNAEDQKNISANKNRSIRRRTLSLA